jgi:ATP-dependent helicase IRC3
VINLRPYQQEAVAAVQRDWQAGYTDLLGTAATGLGKTAIFCALLPQMGQDRRSLILAHRKELIDQPAERMTSYFPDWQGKIGIVMADTDQPDRPLTVATIQSLTASPRRLERILAHGPIDYLVVDECHHNTDKNTYSQVLQALRLANPHLRHLGVTATPIRADGDGLGGVYQKESFHYPIGWGVQNGYLVNIRWLAIEAAVSLDGVKTIHGDFQRSALGRVYETPELLELVVRSYLEYAPERQAIAFTVTVEGAHRLAEAFRSAGVSAASADGTTDKILRQSILDDFAGGKTRVLCNVGLYTEGLDVPQASCILMARPTRSDSLYVQCMGRALRLYPGKEDALILDFAPVDKRNVVMAGDVLGVPLPKKAIFEKKERGQASAGFTYDGSFTWMDGSPVEILSRQLNYLETSPWSWYRHNGYLSLGLGKGSDEVERILIMTPPQDGRMTLYGCWKNGRSWQFKELAEGAFDELQSIADRIANQRGSGSLAAKTRSWRKQPKTDAQIAFARNLHISKQDWETLSKGEIAQLITHTLAMTAIQQVRMETA